MTGKYLVDTSIWVRMLRGDSALRDRLRDAGEIYLCVHVVGELFYGAFRSSQVQKNLTDINEVLGAVVVVRCDDTTALEYGELKRLLHGSGTPLPENDMWIAATALQYDLTLWTDDAHFDALPHLTKERW